MHAAYAQLFAMYVGRACVQDPIQVHAYRNVQIGLVWINVCAAHICSYVDMLLLHAVR